jgi:hypothetical protein
MDRGLKLNDTSLNITASSTDGTLVLPDNIDPGDNDPILL